MIYRSTNRGIIVCFATVFFAHLFFLISYQKNSSQQYRSIIGEVFMNKDSVSFKDILYFLPLECCHYCNYDIKKKLGDTNKAKFLVNVNSLEEPYKSYYITMINYVYNTSPTCSEFIFRYNISYVSTNSICFTTSKFALFKRVLINQNNCIVK